MKKIFTLISFLILFGNVLLSQDFEARVIENEKGYLEYQVRCVNAGLTPTTGTPITQISFEIRWPNTSSADVEVLCSSNHYTIGDGLGAKQSKDAYFWRNFVKTQANPVYSDHDWTTNNWETIVEFKVTGTAGTTDFEVAPHLWVPQDLVWAQGAPTATTYFPSVNGSVSNYDYPTLVYTFVWKGGGSGPGALPTHWNQTNNWENECGGATSTGYWPYQTSENVYIPNTSSGSGYYPETWNSTQNYSYTCYNILIGDGAHVTVPDLSSQSTGTYFNIAGNLKIVNGGKLYLPALGYATISGSTEIDNAEGIEVQADATGVGSFIDNGTITYGTSGTGKVQTYLSNSAGAGSFYMHLVGPTLDDENYTGSGTGAFLSAFNVSPGNTYAYTYDQGTDQWNNINSTTYEVHTGDGIGLSTTDATPYTLNMTGEFITGNVTHSITTGGSNYQLISNPYPSAIDFNALYTSNSTVVNNKTWKWDPSAGNYETWSSGSGNKYVQVGQGFFVETTSAGTFTFTNSERVHNNVAFRDINPNELTMRVSGGDYGFKDQLIVRFVEDATSGYDPAIDAYKINSMYEDATQIESIAEDGSELSINFLPLAGLSGDMVSVPVHFQCGYSGEYTFDFEGIETFEDQNEIWLEDKKDNNNWIYLNNNPHYTFTAVPYEPHDRFILHFFGPTGIDENSVDNPVDIYSYRQYVYIKKNEPNEVIKKVSVYNINGEELFSKRVPDQPVNKLWVSEQVGYYLVRVITDKNSYTGKVFIFK